MNVKVEQKEQIKRGQYKQTKSAEKSQTRISKKVGEWNK